MEEIFKEIQTIVDKISAVKSFTTDEYNTIVELLAEIRFVKLGELMDQIQEKVSLMPIIDEPPLRESRVLISVEQIKADLTVVEMKKIIKKAGISGYSRLNEQALAEIIYDNKLQ